MQPRRGPLPRDTDPDLQREPQPGCRVVPLGRADPDNRIRSRSHGSCAFCWRPYAVNRACLLAAEDRSLSALLAGGSGTGVRARPRAPASIPQRPACDFLPLRDHPARQVARGPRIRAFLAKQESKLPPLRQAQEAGVSPGRPPLRSGRTAVRAGRPGAFRPPSRPQGAALIQQQGDRHGSDRHFRSQRGRLLRLCSLRVSFLSSSSAAGGAVVRGAHRGDPRIAQRPPRVWRSDARGVPVGPRGRPRSRVRAVFVNRHANGVLPHFRCSLMKDAA